MSGRYDRICPCGSGRRYPECCFAVDQRVGYEGPLPDEAIEEARRADYWEAGTAPMFPIYLEDSPDARPALSMIVSGERALAVESQPRPSPEAADVARDLEAVLREARRRVGAMPPELRLRHREVAEAMASRLGSSEPRVVAVDQTPGIDTGGHAMKIGLVGTKLYPLTQSTYTWAGWDQPLDWLAELHSAAAALYRAVPWQRFEPIRMLEAAFADDRRWHVVLMCGLKERPGLMLQGGERVRLAAFTETGEGGGPGVELLQDLGLEALSAIRGRVLQLDFEAGSALHPRMKGEVAAGGWEVADARAYPILSTIHTPGCGLPRRDAADLLAVLRGLAVLVGDHADALEGWRGVDWRDPERGLELLAKDYMTEKD